MSSRASAKCQFCTKSKAIERAAVLIGSYRRDDYADPEIFARALVSVFVRYPEEVVIAVTEPATGVPKRLKWPPSLAEVVQCCEDEFAPIRRAMEREAARERDARSLPSPAHPRSPEEQARIDAQVEEARRTFGIPEGGYPNGHRTRDFIPLGRTARAIVGGNR